ncbi:DUF1830 domain-containing protein [Acaryochloris sp. IP29b_bin.137]|uniref:DUF1830 domain-containing protein n=1 Tax=Acaryochloris sp. IP29b_bin.137 TaxID=2969217 RepID=UPI00262B3012|nr:DUF1830 domain-containing protein [Acaryochloris sp. IP29b_bin.137]
MPQIIDPLPPNDSDPMVCCYVNVSNKIQVARITNIPNWYFERVVFPGQRLLFESVPEAQLEIHTGMMASAILSDTIPCYRLRLHQSVSVSQQYLSEERVMEGNSHHAGSKNMLEFPQAAQVS